MGSKKLNPDIGQYKKQNDKQDPKITTSVFIKTSQQKYIENNSLNLSLIARDAIDFIMRGGKLK